LFKKIGKFERNRLYSGAGQIFNFFYNKHPICCLFSNGTCFIGWFQLIDEMTFSAKLKICPAPLYSNIVAAMRGFHASKKKKITASKNLIYLIPDTKTLILALLPIFLQSMKPPLREVRKDEKNNFFI